MKNYLALHLASKNSCLGFQVDGEETVADGRYDEGYEAEPDGRDAQDVEDGHLLVRRHLTIAGPVVAGG
jgi:hypothetical protein